MVKFTKITITAEEFDALDERQQKRFIMFTNELRDVIFFQKLLIYIPKPNDEDAEPLKAANTTMLMVSLQIFISKMCEILVFIDRNGIKKEINNSPNAQNEHFKPILDLYNTADYKIFKFIRNTFGFHYEYQNKVDPSISRALKKIGTYEAWMADDSANDIFTSSNTVFLEVITNEMKKLEYKGESRELFYHLFAMTIRAAGLMRSFCVEYLASCFPSIQWQEQEEVEVEATPLSDVVFPYITSKS